MPNLNVDECFLRYNVKGRRICRLHTYGRLHKKLKTVVTSGEENWWLGVCVVFIVFLQHFLNFEPCEYTYLPT